MKARLAVSLRAVGVRRADKWVLRGIEWQLKPGERWALLGDNGAGKTQLLKLIRGDIWPTPSRGPGSGRTYRVGARMVDLIEAKTRIAYVGGEHQDKYARYGWNLTVREVVATGLRQTDLLLSPITPPEARRVAAALRACAIKRLEARRFLMLSYGEKRLALLARALIREPDWLLLDEFYNGLDLEYRGRIDAILRRRHRRGQSWIATAHRAMDVPRGTEFLLELADGRIQMTKRLLRADFERLAHRADEPSRGQSRPPRRRKSAVESAPESGTGVLIKVTNADLYVDYRRVLKGLDWRLRRGEHWSVFGANGAGKSTFLKMLYGDLSPALGGRLERRGCPAGTPIMQWKQQVGFVSPELQSTYAVDVTILELVASGRHSSIGLNDKPTPEDEKTARYWLKFFKLLKTARRRPRELSYGQLRRALIARAMAAKPRILLLDEPLTGLDPRQRAIMKRLLETLMKRRVTVIAAVHHAEDLPRGMTHGLYLHKGRAYPSDPYFAT
jgi:molybdate transport system ATP-binding protein